MTRQRYIAVTAILILLQTVLLKSVSLSTWFFLAPVVFIVLSIERGTAPVKGMVVLFLIGMSVDLLSMGIPGLWSASLLASYIPRIFIIKKRAWESEDDLYDMPLPKEMGTTRYFVFAIAVNFVFFLVYVMLEKLSISFTLFDLARMVLSTLLNSVLMVILGLFSQPKPKR